MIEGRYLVTNAHVVWPYDHVRVVFPDGSEHIDAPVIDLDLMVDLAVIGPLETDTDPVDLVDGEELSIGSEVFLVGYPGEVEEYPQPAITRGLISRLRQWESAGMTFFQTDAAVAGGQSGGVLVNNNAEVIGISGLSFSEAAFGLVTSAADVRSRIEGIIVGEDVDGLGQRRLASGGGRRTFTTILGEEEQSRLYVINEPVGTDLRIFVGSRSDEVLAFIASAAVGSVAALLTDPYAFFPEELWGGDTVIVPDGTATVTTTIDSPYFLLLSRFPSEGEPFFSDTANPVRVQVDSNHGLAAYTDPDDGRRITVGETIKANMDFPLDEDQFAIQLEEGDTVSIAVETIAFDALMTVSSSIAGLGDLAVDDDSGGGLFGLNPKLTFSAPYSGRFFIGVSDLNVSDVGGYSLTVSEASPEAAPGR
ncbi:MAG: hypothetical protein BZY88_17490 [SAR202 cluster bacterium Io17-Chloro-G9]|nr:MAG: hypothetical protein BZY88_17490 [SAR202 cluster bacterium Io17-Chloro-G9]